MVEAAYGFLVGLRERLMELKRGQKISEVTSTFYSRWFYHLDFFTGVPFPAAGWVSSQQMNTDSDDSSGT